MQPPEAPSKFQLQVKAGTAIVTVITAGFCLLYDWDRAQGDHNVFSGIRPALKGVLNRLYGVSPGKDEGER